MAPCATGTGDRPAAFVERRRIERKGMCKCATGTGEQCAHRVPGGRRRPPDRAAAARPGPLPPPRRARYRGGDSAITIDPTCAPASHAARRITRDPVTGAPCRAADPLRADLGDLPGVTRDHRAASASEVAPASRTCADRVLARDERPLRRELRRASREGEKYRAAEINASVSVICVTAAVTLTVEQSVALRGRVSGVVSACIALTCGSSSRSCTGQIQPITKGHRPPA